MNETRRLAEQLRRAVEGEAWHGPALLELLADVDAAQAAGKPAVGSHSIWELAQHAAVWQEFVQRRLEGERWRKASDEEDWPPVKDASAAAWKALRERIAEGARQLAAAIERFPAGRLDEKVAGASHSFYVMLQGLIQHDLYHAGQIGLLKRAR